MNAGTRTRRRRRPRVPGGRSGSARTRARQSCPASLSGL